MGLSIAYTGWKWLWGDHDEDMPKHDDEDTFIITLRQGEGYAISVNGISKKVAHASLEPVEADPSTTGINEGYHLSIGWDHGE